GIDGVTYACGISRAGSPDRIVVLERLRRVLAAARFSMEQAKRCLRAHPYPDPPNLRARDVGISPSPAVALRPSTCAARTAADDDCCDSRQEREPSHPARNVSPLGVR